MDKPTFKIYMRGVQCSYISVFSFSIPLTGKKTLVFYDNLGGCVNLLDSSCNLEKKDVISTYFFAKRF